MYRNCAISIINIAIISVLIIILCKSDKELYCEGCLSGKVIAGTVYTRNADNTPGLGWIL